MPEIEVEEIQCRRENDIEHEVAFRYAGRRLKARVLLLNAADKAAWAVGARHTVRIRLMRSGRVVKMASGMRPGLDDEGEAIWRAIGPVLAVDDDIVTVDVGFALEVDTEPVKDRPELTPALRAGDSMAVRGELRVDTDD